MITNITKINSLWKNKEGWANTHNKSEVFEEIYRSFKSISANNVLTYGHLIPRKTTDTFYNEVVNLSSTNPTFNYRESSYKTLPLIEKVTKLQLTSISPNCNDSFVVLDNRGNQTKNIIPYDFGETGLYNYALETEAGDSISFGVCDWRLDIDSAILTFYNGVPEGIDSNHPPLLTFYKYVGPLGERTYIDAALYSVTNIDFQSNKPTTIFTDRLSEALDNIDNNWFNKYKFNGDDNSQGVGLNYNLLTPVLISETKDVLKGWDNASQSQVVSLLSHKKSNNPNIYFTSEKVENGDYTIQIEETGWSKINVGSGFIVVNTEEIGNLEFTISDSENIYSVLLAKNNESSEMDLFIPKTNLTLDLQVPIFADLKTIPPHLKLETLSNNNLSDAITPQYYGPRVADFVIASYEDTTNLKSADYIVYNKTNSYLENALNAKVGNHILIRSGTYENNSTELELNDLHLEGESLLNTKIKNCSIKVSGSCIIENLDLSEVTLTLENDTATLHLNNCLLGELGLISGTLILKDTAVTEASSNGNFIVYNSYFQSLTINSGLIDINNSNIRYLDLLDCEDGSVINSSNIGYVNFLTNKVKLDTSYATEFSPLVDTKLYPNDKTIPYYNSFGDRVFAKLPDPFKYIESSNTIELITDNFTLGVNDEGQLYCRPFQSHELSLTSVPVTQTENKYNIHEDSNLYQKTYNWDTHQFEFVLDEHGDKIPLDKPVTIDDAIIDLYWSKAGLVKGKVPIDQLPDSVAYGGLAFVGMWSFEDHNGKYPTFTDIDTSTMSDDEYTELQKGWFFIVSASHHRTINDLNEEIDDPCYPQIAVDGQEFTAGDWVIFTGKENVHRLVGTHQETIDVGETINYTDLLNNIENNNNLEISTNLFASDLGIDLQTHHTQLTTEGVFDSESLTGVENVLFYVISNDESEPTKYVRLEVDEDLEDINILSIYSYEDDEPLGSAYFSDEDTYHVPDFQIQTIEDYIDEIVYHFEKLDRAYSDPVYSRLPEIAPVTNGVNQEWVVYKGGYGRLDLSYKTLAEALRLINDELWNLTPTAPSTVRNISLILDEENTDGTFIPYIRVRNNGTLTDFYNQEETMALDFESGSIRFKQKGLNDNLILEHLFYARENGEIDLIIDDTSSLESPYSSTYTLDICDPYKKYNLGIKSCEYYKGAEISGVVDFSNQEDWYAEHSIKINTSNLQDNDYLPNISAYRGNSNPLNIISQKFYDGTDVEIGEAQTHNYNALNSAMNIKIAGIPYLTNNFTVLSEFQIKNFIKYESLRKTDTVRLVPIVDGEELEDIEIPFTGIIQGNGEPGCFDLLVRFRFPIGNYLRLADGIHDIKLKTIVSVGNTIKEKEVYNIERLAYINQLPTNIVSTPPVINPSFETISNYNQDTEYSSCAELVYTQDGFRWPRENEVFVNKFLDLDSIEQINTDISSGIEIGDRRYRMMTFKHSFESIKDLSGFYLNIDYTGPEMSLDKFTGKPNNDVLLSVLFKSAEYDSLNYFVDADNVIENPSRCFDDTIDCPILYPGKSTDSLRRISFGKRIIPISDIYIRVLIASDSLVSIKNIKIGL